MPTPSSSSVVVRRFAGRTWQFAVLVNVDTVFQYIQKMLNVTVFWAKKNGPIK
jgi:hypothetical protein